MACATTEEDVDEPTEMTIEAETQSKRSDRDERGTFELTLCIALCGDRPEIREAFCRSLNDPQQRGSCWAHRFDSALSWAGWCVNTF
jgi:hypothetical protein